MPGTFFLGSGREFIYCDTCSHGGGGLTLWRLLALAEPFAPTMARMNTMYTSLSWGEDPLPSHLGSSQLL